MKCFVMMNNGLIKVGQLLGTWVLKRSWDTAGESFVDLGTKTAKQIFVGFQLF